MYIGHTEIIERKVVSVQIQLLEQPFMRELASSFNSLSVRVSEYWVGVKFS